MVLTTRALVMAAVAWLASACDLEPLRRADLFASSGREDGGAASGPDAASAATDTSTTAPDTGGCGGAHGLLSGSVVDRCTGRPVDALVGIAGQHQCSFSGKGSYLFRDLPTGCLLNLSSAAPGYKVFTQAIVPTAEGLVVNIELERASGTCSDPPPEAVPCRCDRPGCV
jgi:hypothetical protein